MALLGVFSAVNTGCSLLDRDRFAKPKTSPSAVVSATPVPIRSLDPGASSSPGTPAPLGTATPTPVPSQQPTGPAISNTARPFHNGDTYAYAGQSQETFVFAGTSPSPASDTTVAIAQNVTVSNNATYNGTSGAYDFKTTELDTTPLQQIGLTNDTYYTTMPTATGTNVVTLGYTSTDTLGEKIAVTVTNPGPSNGLVDILPETSRATWTNSGAQRIDISQSSGFASSRTYAADGTYVDTATYPQAGAANPSATPLVATITQRADGTATYSLPLFGPPNVTITYGAPTNGVIPISITQPGGSASASPIPVQTASVGTWYQTPLKLYDELDRDNGAVAFPAACKINTQIYGTQGNQIEQKFVRTDLALGTLESFDQLTYVVPTYGVVCVTLSDRILAYYDYSGQSNGAPTGVSYSGANSPLQTTTIATTIGLTNATIKPFAIGRDVATETGMRLASARANFLAFLERERSSRQRAAVRHLRTLFLERNKR